MSLTKVTYSMIDGAPVNVLDFGAIGDGVTNDTTAIQNAVDYASSVDGSYVFFPSGTYLTEVVVVGPNVIIEGNGATIKAKTGQNYIFRLLGDNITIQNVIFDSTGLTDVNSNPTDAGLKSSVLYVRVGTGSFDNIKIIGNRFINIPTTSQDYHAVGFNNVTGFVENNYVEACGGDTLNFNGGFINVCNNQIFNSGDGGIALNNLARGHISNNYIYKCDLGIGCGPEGEYPATIFEYTLLISNNTIESCGYGINLGWFSFAGRWGPVNWLINSNIIYRCKRGIRYDGDNSNFVANGAIVGNVFYRTGDDSYDGTAVVNSQDISLNNCSECVISDNVFSEAQGSSTKTGIQLNNSFSSIVNGNKIKHSTNYTTGIQVTDGTDGNITANVITNCVNGIVIDGTGDGNALNVSNNNVNNYTAFGILLSNSSNGTIIKGNRLFTSGATANGIDLSSAIFYVSATSNTVRQTASANCINVNTSLTSDNYQVSYNTVFGGTVTDGGPGGATKNITGNW
jgi:hypothetical protein